MPRFYFHIKDGDKFIQDREGVDMPGVLAAFDEANKAAREKKLFNLPFKAVLRLE